MILLGLIVIVGCKKEETKWNYCTDCELIDWVGEYEGSGEYFNENNNTSELNVPTSIIIENTSGTVLKTKVEAGDKISTSFTSSKSNNKYYYDVPGSNKSLSLMLSKSGSEYKLSGTVKLFHYIKDTVLVIDHSISFDTFKKD